MLRFAYHSRALSKDSLLVFLHLLEDQFAGMKESKRGHTAYHLSQTARSHHISGVHKAIEMPRTLLNLFAHVVINFHVEDIRDEIEGVLVVLYFRIEPSQVEAVRQVVFVDLAEVFISTRRDELRSRLVYSLPKNEGAMATIVRNSLSLPGDGGFRRAYIQYRSARGMRPVKVVLVGYWWPWYNVQLGILAAGAAIYHKAGVMSVHETC